MKWNTSGKPTHATLVVRVSQEPSAVKWSEFLFVSFETNAREKIWFLTAAIPAQHDCLFWQRVLLTCVKLSDT